MMRLREHPTDRRWMSEDAVTVIATLQREDRVVVLGQFNTEIGDYFVCAYNHDGTRANRGSCHTTASRERASSCFHAYGADW